MACDEHKIMQVRFEIKDQNGILAAEQKKLNDGEMVLAQTKVEFEHIQEQRRLVQASITAEMKLASKDQQTMREHNFYSQKTGEERISLDEDPNFQLTNEIQLLQRKIDEKSRLVATVSPVVEHMESVFYFSLTKRKQRKELKSLQKVLIKDVFLLEKAIRFLQEKSDLFLYNI